MYQFFLNISLSFFAAISPGPNIVLVTQNSLLFGRKNGLMTAFGVLAGVLFWLVFLVAGFVYLVNKPKILFAFHIFSSLYLMYIVYLIHHVRIDGVAKTHDTRKAFFFESFVMTLLNAEIAIFYGSILTGILAGNHSKSAMYVVMYVASFMVVESVVFLSCAYFVSSVQKFMVKYIGVIKALTSCAILYFVFRMLIAVYKDYQLLF
jgi:threonine/homoserine/homoserine lactone efflux protein